MCATARITEILWRSAKTVRVHSEACSVFVFKIYRTGPEILMLRGSDGNMFLLLSLNKMGHVSLKLREAAGHVILKLRKAAMSLLLYLSPPLPISNNISNNNWLQHPCNMGDQRSYY